MCFCNDDDYYADRRRRRQSRNLEKGQLEWVPTHVAQGHGWPGETRSNNSQQSHRRKDSFFEPGLAHALVGLPDSDFRAVYDPEHVRHRLQQRVPVSPARSAPDYPPQRHTSTRGIIAEQPSTTSAMTMANHYTQRTPWAIQEHPTVLTRPGKAVTAATYSGAAPPMPSQARLMRRDSNGISEFGSDDENDQPDLTNYSVSPTTTEASPSSTKKVKPKVHSGHDKYGWNGTF
ncbi:hypothetical protein F5Y05DRAFT_154106 [Hypoxylon sp. FL0543]|nr:hypothetical protein F5Y05DRAFT_154106 [Hypoxylon sp. FL0543]